MWKWLHVRAAGFPARAVLALASGDVAGAADAVTKLQREMDQVRHAAIAELKGLLHAPGGPERRLVDKAIKALWRGRLPAGCEGLAAHARSVGVLAQLEEARAHAQQRFEAAFAAERDRTAEVIRAAAAEPRFREAVLWQNRRALRSGMDWLLAHPEIANSRARQNQQMVASYMQRYCVKNDCIGFFGPVAWGMWTGRDAVHVRPGAELLAKRTVYFEHWAIDAIAQLLAQDPELRPSMRPRRMPTVRLDGNTISYPVNRQTELPLPYARLYQACDGTRSARAIATALLADPSLELTDEAEVFEMLTALCDKRLLTWTFEIPTVTEWPERYLRALLDETTGAARDRALATLDALEARRTAVADAKGDAEALDRAFHQLDETFVELTAKSATRKSGETYAARTLVYEDCRRDLELELGADFRQRLGPPLELVLQSARWYTFRIAELYRAALRQAFDEAAQGASSVDYLTFWQHAKGLFPEDRSPSSLVEQATRDLQDRWTAIATLDPAAKRHALSASGIAAQVRELFAAPHPGWPSARYHSPDVLVAARSAEAIRKGEGTIVLGELHPSVCTIHHLAQKEHDDRAALIRARELDLAHVIPSTVYAKEHATRADHMWVSRHDVDIELGTTRSWRPRENVLAVGSLVVARDGDQLVVRDRAGTRSFEVVEFYGAFLNAAIANDFDMFPLATHLPRVTIDGVVIARERWRPALDTLGFAALEQPAEQFLAARRWAQQHDLPRWVFVKVPEEPKPVYVDFDSPIYVEMLAKLIRKASKVTVSEMVPSPEETWVPDADGQTYTCELRLVAVDPTRWSAPLPPRS